MSHALEFDNEEPLFQFDTYDEPVDVASNSTHPDLVDVTHNISPFALSAPNLIGHTLDRTIAQEMDERDTSVAPEDDEGKGVSEPMSIRPQVNSMHDNFDMGSSTGGCISQPGTSYAHSPPLTSSSFDLQSIQTPLDDIYHRLTIPGHEDAVPIPGSFNDESQVASGSLPDKSKAKEFSPTLPPLQFSPTSFGYSKADWPSPGLITPTPGPSSYGSGYGSVIESNINLTLATENEVLSQSPPILRRMPSRRRSFSNLSIHSTRSMAALSMSRVKVKFGTSKGPGNLARKLLFRSRPGSSASSPPPTPGTTTPRRNFFDTDFAVGQGNCLMPWRNDYKSQARDVPPVPYLDLEAKLNEQTLPVYRRSQKAAELKGKGRSYSSPLPLSAFDIIPSVPTNNFTPIPIIPRNYFDEVLPRELRLRVLSLLIDLHEAEHDRAIKEGDWTVMRASSSKNRWVGKDKGMRELIKFSRVSKSWQVLVFDGQMWSHLNLCAFPRIPPSLLTRLSRAAGTFVKTIDVSGHAGLLPSTLIDVTDELCLPPAPNGQLPHTQLTAINLQGCAGLTTRSLHHLLMRSPSLHTVCLKGLTAVTNTTCDVLGVYCAQLVSLDIGRCMNVDGEGICRLIAAGMNRGDNLPLKELRVSGMKRVDDDVLATLGKGAPLLEVLDLSYIRDLHNSALEAFVSCSEDDGDTQFETVLLTSREAGRDQTDSTRYRRRVTRLRHLSLSSCVLLTDNACTILAHTVPCLEFLEMAGIGADLRDDGLVRLLNTTPFIRKLDLEDASEITDTVIAAITPSSLTRNSTLEPGHALEHLGVSYAANLSEEAFLSLIQNCPHLSVLEADNTRISGTVLKEFVRLSRNREMVDPVAVVIDCRGVGESLVKELSGSTRPRKGWRSYEARKLGYVDGRDKEDLKVGRDECDSKRVVLKSFYSWQTVDAVRAAREKRRKAKRAANASGGSTSDSDDVFSGRARWWSPSGRRSSGNTSPTVLDVNGDRDQCRII